MAFTTEIGPFPEARSFRRPGSRWARQPLKWRSAGRVLQEMQMWQVGTGEKQGGWIQKWCVNGISMVYVMVYNEKWFSVSPEMMVFPLVNQRKKRWNMIN